MDFLATMKHNITLGADPEFHLMRGGRVVSALKALEYRDKHNPIDLKDGMKMYADNALIECAFPPMPTVAEMMVHMRNVFVRMQEQLGAEFSLLPKAAVMYDPAELSDVEVWESGCNPNFNAYTGEANLPADFTNELRTGSFHVHIGHPSIQSDPAPKGKALVLNDAQKIAIKLMDIIVGCASIVFDQDDSASLRRSLYGRAGECRPTPYGIEYRVLGPWALTAPVTTEIVWDLAAYATQIIEDGYATEVIDSVGETWAQLAINGPDKDSARMVLKRAGLGWKMLERINHRFELGTFNENWAI